MRDDVKRDILNVLTSVEEAIVLRDAERIKEMSNHVIHSASIFQDKYTVTVAVLVYALSKIMDKEREQKYEKVTYKEFLEKIQDYLEEAINSLRKGNLPFFEMRLRSISHEIYEFDKNFSQYMQYVIQKAKIKKAIKIYEHGISLGTVAELLGVSEWELMEYGGKTRVHEHPATITLTPKERMKKIKELLEK